MRVKVLIAEDSPLIRRRLAALVAALEGVSHVLEAPDAPSALRLAAAEAPRVVLLDLQLPGVRGLELVRTLAALSPAVIVLTAAGGEALRRRLLACGACAIFDKASNFLDAVRTAGTLIKGAIRQ